MGKIYRLQYEQVLNTSLDNAWTFFSRAENLEKITPSYMRFDVTSPETGKPVYAGQVITYVIHPVLGIPLNWMTEITHVVEGKYFVDEQRKGPYGLWHHQHHFEVVPEGVKMTDIVHYSLPLGLLGRIAHALFVQRQLRDIFAFRKNAVEHLLRKA
ncbi:SRPBCC family protein [Chitinophaga sp. S165]|uniref:SRPBCC family protein n=1 Tax=Chitinophaga sp. S165 TaxID=2135462 RepID=UPI000D70FC7A|nr:SRPBCC family protein [Chitinophaga sp. S165]PWV53726.1 ligand-binding SRPBCC domain-containing protein [Chitinophaga sp. S165]